MNRSCCLEFAPLTYARKKCNKIKGLDEWIVQTAYHFGN